MCCVSLASPSEETQTFLIIQTAFLGDAILSTSVLEKLHDTFPKAEIDILVRKGNESIFEQHPFIRNVITWDKKFNKYINLFDVLKIIRRNKYNHVINLQRFGASGLLTAFSGAGRTHGFNKNPFSLFFSHRVKHVVAGGVHEINRNQTLIAGITNDVPVNPKLHPTKEHLHSVQNLKSAPYITISPASVWYTKTFPNFKWMELIQFLNSRTKYNIYLLGSQAELDYCDFIRTKSGATNVTNLCGTLSILESAALMQDAVMNYVNDSAPLHIASATNSPVTAIYCSTVPEFGFGPLSLKSKIIQTTLPLTCKPCGLHGFRECPLTHFKCGRSIEVNENMLP